MKLFFSLFVFCYNVAKEIHIWISQFTGENIVVESSVGTKLLRICR